ncbi:MAG TPA: TMEM175 family protein [Gemmatimonadales bacterium]
MTRGRLEAFSDGVIAILITIMVLGFQVPHGASWAALRAELPLFLSYALSFVYLGIYWSNHHHLFQAVKQVDGRVLWANLHLLFWLSLVPFITGWVAESHLARAPTALYGVVFLLAAVAYTILTRVLLALHGQDSALAKALGDDLKGKISLALYAAGILVALVQPRVAAALYVVVAIIWFVPDRRIEKVLAP